MCRLPPKSSSDVNNILKDVILLHFFASKLLKFPLKAIYNLKDG